MNTGHSYSHSNTQTHDQDEEMEVISREFAETANHTKARDTATTQQQSESQHQAFIQNHTTWSTDQLGAGWTRVEERMTAHFKVKHGPTLEQMRRSNQAIMRRAAEKLARQDEAYIARHRADYARVHKELANSNVWKSFWGAARRERTGHEQRTAYTFDDLSQAWEQAPDAFYELMALRARVEAIQGWSARVEYDQTPDDIKVLYDYDQWSELRYGNI